jgi:hypothetical protein
MSIVRASVQNWFTNDNMRMKSKIEARCGMYVYLMNILVKFYNDNFLIILIRVMPLFCTSSLLNVWFPDDNL